MSGPGMLSASVASRQLVTAGAAGRRVTDTQGRARPAAGARGFGKGRARGGCEAGDVLAVQGRSGLNWSKLVFGLHWSNLVFGLHWSNPYSACTGQI